MVFLCAYLFSIIKNNVKFLTAGMTMAFLFNNPSGFILVNFLSCQLGIMGKMKKNL